MNDIVSTACPACRMAEQNVLTGAYQAGCFECTARSIANSPAYFNAHRWAELHGQRMHPDLRALLERAGDGAWKQLYERVKVWAARAES